MTAREKTLATGLVVAMGITATLGALFFFALEPAKAAIDRAKTAQGYLDTKNGEYDQELAQVVSMRKLNPRLTEVNKISLPPRDPSLKKGQPMTDELKRKHLNRLQVDYEAYLDQLLRRHKFKSDTIVITPRQIEKQTTAKGKQAPVFERLAFSVGARGELGSVSRMLEEFHSTPLLHQVRNVTVDLVGAQRGGRGRSSQEATDGTLDLKMTVEALLVTGAEDRATLVPPRLNNPLKVLASDTRDYSLMTKKNMFVGIKPPEKKVEKKDPPKVDPPPTRVRKEDPADVLSFVKLTMLCYDPDRRRWEATFYDQAKGGDEKKVNTRVLSDLTVYDGFDQPSLEAKIVYIDETQLILRKLEDKKYYRVKCGDVLWPAVDGKTPLKASELKELGIDTR